MASGKAGTRVVLMHDTSKPLLALERVLRAQDHCPVGCFEIDAPALASVSLLRPDVVLACVEVPTDDTLEVLGRLQRAHPAPMALVAERSDPRLTRRVIRIGISDYVIGSLERVQLGTLFDVAITRFDWQQQLLNSLQDARIRLADQRDIGRAKGLIMKRRELDEDQAYRLLRKMAMDRKQLLGDFSRQLLVAAEAL